ncbi:MAG: hypothetical protein J6R30_01900 [Bacteroidales bacterium]|nr:hypothetical protein [Bacteroidales bacterium]
MLLQHTGTACPNCPRLMVSLKELAGDGDYEHGCGTSFIKGEDGSFDNVTVGINKAARKEKVRKAIQESKRKTRKAAKKNASKKQ